MIEYEGRRYMQRGAHAVTRVATLTAMALAGFAHGCFTSVDPLSVFDGDGGTWDDGNQPDNVDADSDGQAEDDGSTGDGTSDNGSDGSADGGAGECPSGMAFVPAGPFVMGTDPEEGSESSEPEHIVQLSAYCIDLTELTNAAYLACENAGVCTPPHSMESAIRSNYHENQWYRDFPVIHVDWNQASVYCAWAGKRLPTEAEWEKAARGGCEIVPPDDCLPDDERRFPWGDDSGPNCDQANYSSCSIYDTDAVGVRPLGDSPYGVHDMTGNVWEWVSDWLDYGYYEWCEAGCTDPTGPDSGMERAMRGGFFGTTGSLVLTYRYGEPPDQEREYVGLRCAWSAE